MQKRFLGTPEAVGQAVRDGRAQKQFSQAVLAEKAGVSRKFVSELENGHPRAELGKTIRVLRALDIHAVALPPGEPFPPGAPPVDLDEALREYRRG